MNRVVETPRCEMFIPRACRPPREQRIDDVLDVFILARACDGHARGGLGMPRGVSTGIKALSLTIRAASS